MRCATDLLGDGALVPVGLQLPYVQIARRVRAQRRVQRRDPRGRAVGQRQRHVEVSLPRVTVQLDRARALRLNDREHLLLDEVNIVVVAEDRALRRDRHDFDVRVRLLDEAFHDLGGALGRVVRRVGLRIARLAGARDEDKDLARRRLAGRLVERLAFQHAQPLRDHHGDVGHDCADDERVGSLRQLGIRAVMPAEPLEMEALPRDGDVLRLLTATGSRVRDDLRALRRPRLEVEADRVLHLILAHALDQTAFGADRGHIVHVTEDGEGHRHELVEHRTRLVLLVIEPQLQDQVRVRDVVDEQLDRRRRRR